MKTVLLVVVKADYIFHLNKTCFPVELMSDILNLTVKVLLILFHIVVPLQAEMHTLMNVVP